MRMKNKGVALWEKAKKIIPGGNQLFSKRSEKFLPNLWPSYYSKAKGCEVWDLDGKHYYDFAGMGVGSCIIGYADDDINKAVIESIINGSMSSLNSYEEVALAEKLIDLHPWAEMVRFARTGGEACAIAVRIGRAATGKSKIAFCGYHGWHDWYLSSNLGEATNLDGQLLPGLMPKGVPRELKNTALPFNYNSIDELEALVQEYKNEIGVIIMEPTRASYPENDFLHKVRKIADEIGAVLIFDEVTSGFRMRIGGIHLNLGVAPDIAVFGKAMGNGFPISAIVGRRAVMDHAQDSFISSTFWTERIGFVAALAAIEKMKTHDVQKHLIDYGQRIMDAWIKVAEKYDLDIHVDGIPPLCHISFKVPKPLEIQTLYTQEMLEKGYLMGAAIGVTYAYSADIVTGFIEATDQSFQTIREALDSKNVKKYLKNDTAHAGFKRLT